MSPPSPPKSMLIYTCHQWFALWFSTTYPYLNIEPGGRGETRKTATITAGKRKFHVFFCRVSSSFAQGCRLSSGAINRCVWSVIVMLCPQNHYQVFLDEVSTRIRWPYFPSMFNTCDVTLWRHKMVQIVVENSVKLSVKDWMTDLEATSVA